MKKILLGVLVTALGLLPEAKADWLNFRGPNGSGFAAGETGVPTELSPETLAWSVKLPGRGLGSPIAVGDKVIVSAASGPDQKTLHVICFSAVDGSKTWERFFRATGRTMCHQKTCVAAPTPASDGKNVYVIYSSNDLVALDLDGNPIWMRGLTLDYPNASNSLGMASSPIVVDDTLIAQVENDSESLAVGIDTMTGQNKWKLDRPKGSNWTSPTVVKAGDQTVVNLQSNKGIHGVLPATGSEIYTFSGGASGTPSSVVADGKIYVPSNGLTALEPPEKGGDMKQLWNETAQRPGTSSPLAVGDKIFTINNAGVLTSADRATGERGWRIRLKGPFSGSPVAADNGHLYIFNEAGIGQVVDLAGEEGKVVSEMDLKETILATPSISGGAVYIRSDGTLWKFGGK
ncbi:MAG: PQQ-binding-like beta-propeller repeat protein [Verrucomicrobiales bacterium]|nr:PQQ-binding-like beta-propeller repeat protein [Verrucomicrobiales bacterium]